DFGTGYSSMSALHSFPIDTVKVDRSFVSRLGQDTDAATIVAAIVSLARAMGLSVTSEGIETEEQVSHLQGFGCDTAQGYYFARPMPAEAFAEHLSEGRMVFAPLVAMHNNDEQLITRLLDSLPTDAARRARSEERRVGKECRARGGA